MTKIRFYHMERSSLEQTLPALITKALSQGHRIIIKSSDEKTVEALNTHLWTYNEDSFLPHGSKKDGHAEDQPIWLTDTDENPNKADVLILTHGATSEAINEYTLCCEMLDGNDQTAVQEARNRWKTYKKQDMEISYWQQGQNGWELKAGS